MEGLAGPCLEVGTACGLQSIQVSLAQMSWRCLAAQKSSERRYVLPTASVCQRKNVMWGRRAFSQRTDSLSPHQKSLVLVSRFQPPAFGRRKRCSPSECLSCTSPKQGSPQRLARVAQPVLVGHSMKGRHLVSQLLFDWPKHSLQHRILLLRHAKGRRYFSELSKEANSRRTPCVRVASPLARQLHCVWASSLWP